MEIFYLFCFQALMMMHAYLLTGVGQSYKGPRLSALMWLIAMQMRNLKTDDVFLSLAL